jgi:hypothetical protein
MKFDSLQYLTDYSIAFYKPLLVNDGITRSANSRPQISSSSYQWSMRTAYSIIPFMKMLKSRNLNYIPVSLSLFCGENRLTVETITL